MANKNKFFQIKNLSVDLKLFKLKNISFAINKGDYLSIIGPTGAGKTILLESILGVYKNIQGAIFLKGKDITHTPLEKRNIGIIYQDYALFPHLTVMKNIGYSIKNKDSNRIFEISRHLNISHLLDRYPDTLSGGEKQRVAMARALIIRPELLLMDEPFSALDYTTKSEIRKLIGEIAKKFNITIIHITHDFDDVWSLANKVAIIKSGNLLQFGSLEEIMFKPKNHFIAKFTDTNLFEGVVINKASDLTFINADGFILSSIDNAQIGEKVKVAVRPENIVIFKKKPVDQSARNVITAYYEDYFVEKNIYHIILKINNKKIKAFLTKNAFEEFNFEKERKVFLIIKATTVRII